MKFLLVFFASIFLSINAFYVDEKITFNDNSPKNDVDSSFRQHPWIGIVEHGQDSDEDYSDVVTGCAATLISKRHLLVAAHCVTGAVVESLGSPMSVRLGEYDKGNEGRDCELFDDYMECTDEPLTADIKKVVVYPTYEPGLAMKDDLAVIHLTEDADKTDFIAPISLPHADVTKTLEDGSYGYIVAGWGTVVSGHNTDKKNHTEKPFVEFGRCQEYYQKVMNPPPVWGEQLCAGGDEENSFCQEDSGGALVRKVNNNYYVDGISSFAVLPCTSKAPVVYTKVHSYLDWILEEMMSLD